MPRFPKRLIVLVVLGALSQASLAQAGPVAPSAVAVYARASDGTPASRSITLVLAGSPESNEIHISLSADGRSYLIWSSAELEAGGEVCANLPSSPDELTCDASEIAGFEFNGGAGDDTVILSRSVPAPATLRGGPGNDTLVGGAGDDLLVGGPGNDTLLGRGGDDHLFGGPGEDKLIGGPGEDTCIGGPGFNTGVSCEIEKSIP
jgi:hypothetical protein